MSFPTPFAEYEGEVLSDWIDSNDHMNLAYYLVLFDFATDAIYAKFGIGRDYKTATNCGTFAAETHILYQQELRQGERVRVASRVLAVDAKRLHLGHEMLRLPDLRRAATQELMYLHVDLAARHTVPWPEQVRRRMDDAAAAHAALPRPGWVGRRVAMS